MTWGWTGIAGTWSTPRADESMRLMSEHGVNWVALAYATQQATATSTLVPVKTEQTVSDDEIRHAIRHAKTLGLRVCLKPVVNVADGTWRAYIGFFDWDVPGEPTWGEWFATYRLFILHAARLAQEEGCDMLCIGCEMVRADSQEAHWRALIADVREVYHGPITYNCDKYQEDHVTWWDAVDVISSSGYYPLGAWPEQLDRIETVVRAQQKPFFFMEAGCPSRSESPARPNDWALPGEPSGAAQHAYYEDMLAQCRSRPWVGGLMLWDWPADLYSPESAETNDDYCPYAKPAGELLRREYRAWQAEWRPGGAHETPPITPPGAH